MNTAESYQNDYGGSRFVELARGRLDQIVSDDYKRNTALQKQLISSNTRLLYAQKAGRLRNMYELSLGAGDDGVITVMQKGRHAMIGPSEVFMYSVYVMDLLQKSVPGRIMLAGQGLDEFTDEHVNLYVAAEMAEAAFSMIGPHKHQHMKTAWNLLWDAAYFAPDNWFDEDFSGLDLLTRGYIGLAYCSFIEQQQAIWDRKIGAVGDSLVDRIVDCGGEMLDILNNSRGERKRCKGSPADIARKQTDLQTEINVNLQMAIANLMKADAFGESGMLINDLVSRAYYDLAANVPEEKNAAMSGFIAYRRRFLDELGTLMEHSSSNTSNTKYIQLCEQFVRIAAEHDEQAAREFAGAVFRRIPTWVSADRFPTIKRLA